MLIIGNGRLVTRDAGQPFFENGAVAIDGTTIKKVGTLDEIKKEFPEAEFVDAKGGVIMPAFINTAMITPLMPAMLPTERSIPPLAITKVIPNDRRR